MVLVAAIALALELQVGDRATVDLAAGDARCARVSYVDRNPGGVAWCWLELEQLPGTVVRSRLELVRPGCS